MPIVPSRDVFSVPSSERQPLLRWHILTGEYPPQRGGVADYSRLVARGLVEAGDEVFVWAPSQGGELPRDQGVHVRPLPDNFGPTTLARLDQDLTRLPGRVLLQYTPHAFGWKAMNVPLCAWLYGRRRAFDVMFHEVAYPWLPRQSSRHRLLALAHRGMASLLLRGADRVFMSIPGWRPLLERLAPRFPTPVWMPVPSNLASPAPADEVEVLRQRLRGASCAGIVGHFGTYGLSIVELLEPVMVDLLESIPDLRVVLLGRGNQAFADRLLCRNQDWKSRLEVQADPSDRAISAHLAACDVLLQPYPDGISSRRGSAMAGIGLGLPIVTTEGHLTESLWRETGAVALAPANGLTQTVQELLEDAPRRAELRCRASALYQARFAVEHTIRALRQSL